MRTLAIAAIAVAASLAAAAPSQASSFNRIDSNNDGFISRAEWGSGHGLGRGFHFGRFDRDNDDRLSEGEYDRLRHRLFFRSLHRD